MSGLTGEPVHPVTTTSLTRTSRLVKRLALAAVSLLVLSVLTAQGATNQPFSVIRREGNSWLVTPNGQRFFSFGVCVVNQGASAQNFNPTNPGYAAFQHYANSNLWAEDWDTLARAGWENGPVRDRLPTLDERNASMQQIKSRFSRSNA